MQKFTVRSDPKRDPRKHIVSIFYLIEVPDDAECQPGDDAATCAFYELQEVYNRQADKFAFDHYGVLTELIQRKKLF